MSTKNRWIWTWFTVALSVITLGGCGSKIDSTTEVDPVSTGKFMPPAGTTLLIVGQDNDTINSYLSAVGGPKPAGFTSYTSLERLEGLESATDYGAGTIHLDSLAEDNPESVLVLGLYLVDYLDELNSGEVDDKIDYLIDYLSAYDRPVFIRFGYEFDGPWNRYEPEEYKQAWIKFHHQLSEKEVTNIAMVWQSANSCGNSYLGQPLESWYPGDQYVDWIGMSLFTQSDCNYLPLTNMLDFAREHHKPIMIAESAPQRYDIGNLTISTTGSQFKGKTAEEIWAEWYEPYFDLINENQDIIRAVAYINTHWDSQPMWGKPYQNGYWGDSRIQANLTIQERWSAEINQSNWKHASPLLFNELGYQTNR